MDQSEKDAGTIAVLMLRMEESRIPRAERMLEKVDQGETLSDSDMSFLHRVYEDYRANQLIIERNHDFAKLMNAFFGLYTEIIEKAIKNEELRGPSDQ